MSWSSDDNPWSNQPKGPQRKPSRPGAEVGFEELLEKLKKQFKDSPSFNQPHKKFGLFLGGAFLIWLASGFYTVKEAEQAVILRFGKYQETMSAGLRYHLPFPIEEAIKKNVAANNYLSSEQRVNLVQREQEDFYMLTGDENLVELDKYTILWRIKDLKKFLFNVRSPQAVILATADSALREVIAKTPINLIITERRAQVNEEVTKLLQELLDHYDSGIHIGEFLMQKADPPEPVLDAFLDVTRAEADRERSQHESRAYRDEILPKARSIAKKMQLDSEGYAREVVTKSEGDAGRFLHLLKEYAKAPEATRLRLYTETMEAILGGASKLVVDGQNMPLHPYLPLDELKPRSKKATGNGESANTHNKPSGEAQ